MSNLRAFAVVVSASIAWFSGVETSKAVVLAQYQFTSNSGASTDSDLLTTASSVTFGTFTGAAASAVAALSNNEAQVRTDATAPASYTPPGTDVSGALTNGAYITFTLLTNGNATSIGSLSFLHLFRNANPGIGNPGIAVFSSLTGFTSSDSLGTFLLGTGTNGAILSASRVIDLSSNSSFQNITGDVEFRIYFYDTSTATDRYHAIDNLVLSTEVIPEPSVSLLAAAGALAMIRRKRRN